MEQAAVSKILAWWRIQKQRIAFEEEMLQNQQYYEEEHYREYEEEFIPCHRCGSDCSGGDYERWRLCSRYCMVRDSD